LSSKIYIDGQLYDKADAKISVYDHGLLYGDGVFEGIRVYSNKIFEVDAHLSRLWASAKSIRLEIPLSREKFKAAIEQTVKANNMADCYVRAVVTRGIGNLGIDPKNCANPSIIIIADRIQVYPADMYGRGMSVMISSIVRNPSNALPPRVKSLNYLNNILARLEANEAGVAEAIMLNQHGNVSECTADNIFIVRGPEVQTPLATDDILEGVTRRIIFELCARLSIPCAQKALRPPDLFAADECFVTGTGAEVMPVTKIDGRTVGTGQPGPITKQLTEAFHKHVRGQRG
jgi:branched-chain amino acid aminotransferase